MTLIIVTSDQDIISAW